MHMQFNRWVGRGNPQYLQLSFGGSSEGFDCWFWEDWVLLLLLLLEEEDWVLSVLLLEEEDMVDGFLLAVDGVWRMMLEV